MEAILSLFASINALAEQINAKMIYPILSTKLEIIKNIITEVSDSALLNQKDAPIQHSFSQRMSSWEHQKQEQDLSTLMDSIYFSNHILQHIPNLNLNSDSQKIEDSLTLRLLQVCSSFLAHIVKIWTNIHKKHLTIDLQQNKKDKDNYKEDFKQLKFISSQIQHELKSMIDQQQSKEGNTQENHKKTAAEPQHSNSASSVRSLLTEKLKLLKSVNNQDDFFCPGEKIVAENNHIMKEMKEFSRGTATEPYGNIENLTDLSLTENFQSMKANQPSNHKGSPKSRTKPKRLLKQMTELQLIPKQVKAKNQKTCCPQCDIY